MTTIARTFASATTSGGPFRVSRGRVALVLALVELLALWQERAIQRRQLAGFDDRQLKDIGVDEVEAAREAAKPFWRA